MVVVSLSWHYETSEAHYCQLKESTSTHSLRFVIGLIQRHKVCKLGGDKLHRPPVVALKQIFLIENISSCAQNSGTYVSAKAVGCHIRILIPNFL